MVAVLATSCGGEASTVEVGAEDAAPGERIQSVVVVDGTTTTSDQTTSTIGSAPSSTGVTQPIEPPSSEASGAGSTVPDLSEPATAPAGAAPAEQSEPEAEAQAVGTVARGLGPPTWVEMARFAEVTLVHPSNRVERVGFHESNHDGARQLEPAPSAVHPLVLESRDRGTGSSTAADVVVEPGTEIRAPVTGTVLRAGGYILYCEHDDDFVVIEPDARPGWEVKVLHISGVMVAAGDRVEAGVTALAPSATPLPFDSQVDEFTAEPSWPHVHLEVVDPSIPDRPSSGGGC